MIETNCEQVTARARASKQPLRGIGSFAFYVTIGLSLPPSSTVAVTGSYVKDNFHTEKLILKWKKHQRFVIEILINSL